MNMRATSVKMRNNKLVVRKKKKKHNFKDTGTTSFYLYLVFCVTIVM